MATVRHAFDSAKDDPVDSSVVGASKWDADHVIEGVFEYLTPTGGDDTAMLAAAIAAAPEGGALLLSGTFLGTIDVVGKRIHINGDGASTVIRGTSAGPIISMDGAGDIAGYGLKDLKVINDGAGGGVELRVVHHSLFSNVMVTKCGGTAWQLYGCLLNQFDNCSYTVNEDFPDSGNAKIGLALDYDATLDSGSNANTFVNFVAEGCNVSPGVGIDLVNCTQNVFFGPTSEGNTIGVRFGATAYTNALGVTWLEANGTDLSGTIGSNSISYRLTHSDGREHQIFNGDMYLRNPSSANQVLGIGLPETTALSALAHLRVVGSASMLRLDSDGTNNPGLLFAIAGTGGTPIASIQSADSGTFRELQLNPAGGIVRLGDVLWFGSDVDLYRSAANVLKTDDALVVASTLTLGSGLVLTGISSGHLRADGMIQSHNASAVALAFSAYVGAEATSRWTVDQSGRHAWGDGTAAVDTNLYRSAADALKTDDKFTALVLATIGLTGATTATRLVGGTASGAPASGTFAVNDVAIAADGHIFVCTVAGTPGTWTDVGASGGAPTTADYLVGTTNGGLSAEIVVGTTPGGELGGTWASPTVDATHAGTTHSAASDTHVADTTTAHAAASVDAVAVGGGGTETVKAVGNTGSTETIALALSDGNVQTFTVNADCTFTMPSSLGAGAKSFTAILTDSGGPRAITFTGVKWSGGANPTVMSGASAVDIFTFLTIDGGTTWYGFIGGQAMAV